MHRKDDATDDVKVVEESIRNIATCYVEFVEGMEICLRFARVHELNLNKINEFDCKHSSWSQ